MGQTINHKSKTVFSIAACGLFFTLLCAAVTAFPAQGFAKENKKYASLVLDADTGMILHQRHADKKLHPASLTKIMTLMMPANKNEISKHRDTIICMF